VLWSLVGAILLMMGHLNRTKGNLVMLFLAVITGAVGLALTIL
jgi:hypothetical protein